MSAAADSTNSESEVILDVRDLSVRFTTPEGELTAVNQLIFKMHSSAVLALFG